MVIKQRQSANGKKIYYRFVWRRQSNDKISAGIFTYTKPKNQVEKNHNKEAIMLLEIKRSELIIEQQSIGTGYIPAHRYKSNFLDFYQDFVKKMPAKGSGIWRQASYILKRLLPRSHCLR